MSQSKVKTLTEMLVALQAELTELHHRLVTAVGGEHAMLEGQASRVAMKIEKLSAEK
jgi:hypothetical protein